MNMEHQWDDNFAAENRSAWMKACPNTALFTANAMRIALGLNSGLCGP
jgi:hypothetical protein